MFKYEGIFTVFSDKMNLYCFQEYFCSDFVKLEDVKTWSQLQPESDVVDKENDEVKAKLLEGYNINEELDLSEKVRRILDDYDAPVCNLAIEGVALRGRHHQARD